MNAFTILLTPSAKEYFSNKVGKDKTLQIRLKSSGCSGYSYIMNIVEKSSSNLYFQSISFDILEEDRVVLNDVIIDVKKDGLNSKVVFENPQAFNHCGCGESFSIRK